jgi:hypothetical protein
MDLCCATLGPARETSFQRLQTLVKHGVAHAYPIVGTKLRRLTPFDPKALPGQANPSPIVWKTASSVLCENDVVSVHLVGSFATPQLRICARHGLILPSNPKKKLLLTLRLEQLVEALR